MNTGDAVLYLTLMGYFVPGDMMDEQINAKVQKAGLDSARAPDKKEKQDER